MFAKNGVSDEEIYHFEYSEEFNGVLPLVDHMHLDDTGAVEYLYGTTRGSVYATSGSYVYIWKVQLDPDHKPDLTTAMLHKVEGEMINHSGEGQSFVALKPTLVDGNLHAIWRKHDGKVLYTIYDWSAGSSVSFEMHDVKFEFPTWGIFTGSKTEAHSSFTVYQSYIGGSSEKFKLAVKPDYDPAVTQACIVSNLDSESCLKYKDGTKWLSMTDTGADMFSEQVAWRVADLSQITLSLESWD